VYVARFLASGRRWVGSWLTSSSIAGHTEAQRSAERNRRAVANGIAALILRGFSFVVLIMSVPLTLDLLGPIRFGMWMTIASVVALLSATDLGIGSGVLNTVSRAFGEGDRSGARRYLASGLVALAGIALLLGAVFVYAYPRVPWADLYNVRTDTLATSEAGPATAVFVATFLIGMPLGLVGQVRAAHQEGFVQSAFAGLGNILTTAFLLVAVAVRASLPVLVLAMTSGPIIAAIVNLIVLVRHQRPWLRPRRQDVTKDAMRSVVRIGLAFMVLQLAYTVAFSADRIVVAQILGPAAVADYSVAYRLFSIPAALAEIALLQLWPAYREAISRHDIAWVRLTLKRSLIVTIVATIPLATILVIAGPTIVDLWTSGGLSPTSGLYVALGAFTVAQGVANVFQMLLNGAQEMRFQTLTMTSMAILNLAASVYLASRIGVAGVAVGSVIAIIAMLIIPALVYVPRLLRRLGQSAGQSVTRIHVDHTDVGP
jgi:O-antigen/teichoic acid export membrane protein